MKNQKGNIMLIAMLFIAAVFIIFVFIMSVFISQTNNLIYRIKTEMYMFNRNGIIAVNKNIASEGKMSYAEKEYKKYFIESLKKNYELNENLENKEGIIEKVEIEEYKILKKREKDSYTKKRSDDVILHTVVKIEVKPIIMPQILDKVFVFYVHEDVVLNGVKM